MSRFVTAFVALVLLSLSDVFESMLPTAESGSPIVLLAVALAAVVLPPIALRLLLRTPPVTILSLGRLKSARRLASTGPLLFLIVLLALGARPAIESVVPPQVAGGSALLLLLPFALSWIVTTREWLRFENQQDGIHESLGVSVRRELRPAFLILGVYVLIAAIGDLSWSVPEWRETAQLHPLASVGGVVVAILGMVFLSPSAVGLIHPKHPLPPGPLRERFERTAEAAGAHLGRIDVWETGPRPALNACVAGAIPRHRRVFFTDGLIQALDEQQLAGVFAHELAHSKLHHLWIYTGLILGLAGITLGLEDQIGAVLASESVQPPPQGAVELSLVLLMGFFFFRFFGVLSRHLESQADLFSARTTGSPYGIISSLERIGRLTGTLDRPSGWRHPALRQRIATVLQWWGDPAQRIAFRKRTRKLLLVWGGILILGTIGATSALRTQLDRPDWRVRVDRAEYLIVAVHERQARPGSSPQWQNAQAERARVLLLEALDEIPVLPQTRAMRRSIYRSLGFAYRLLDDPWSAAMADFFSLLPEEVLPRREKTPSGER